MSTCGWRSANQTLFAKCTFTPMSRSFSNLVGDKLGCLFLYLRKETTMKFIFKFIILQFSLNFYCKKTILILKKENV